MFSRAIQALVLCTVVCMANTAALATPQPHSGSPVVLSETVNAHHVTDFSHASTILGCKGWMLAAWFGGTREQASDTGIWLSRRSGGHWSPPVEVANGVQPDGSRLPVWNPVLFSPRHGPVMLFYTVGATAQNWWPMRIVSWDQGKTWSAPQHLAAGITGPAKNKPVELENGTIVSPGSTETSGWNIRFALSRDGAKTWQEVDPPKSAVPIDAIQPAILNHHGGHIEAVGRTRNGHVFSVSSSDYGRHWSPMTLLPLLNPNSGVDGITLSDGRDLLVLNPAPLVPGEKGRGQLSVLVSSDHKTWRPVLDLENERGEEFSYPAVIQTPDGLVHITYTYKRKEIRHVVLDPRRIEAQQLAGPL
ncbi:MULTISPECIES: sialidase family protein [Paraburkholderia]|uniref:sialidase family protein n=1 Tax=Paraburkholderia TaxID=1822464 RepID=UPI0038BC84A9